MKLVVTADFHLRDKDLEEQVKSLEQIVQYCKQERISNIAILGDIYDHYKPSSQAVSAFITFLTHLPSSQIYLIAGNHDTYPNNKNTAIDWVPLIKDNITFHPKELELTLDNHKVKLVHRGYSESSIGSGNVKITNYSCKNETADVILAGDIHKAQVFSTCPLALHPGSIIRLTFGERDEEKGFFVLDTLSLTFQFITLSVLPMYQYTITSKQELIQKLTKVPRTSKVKIIVQPPSSLLSQETVELIKVLKQIKKEFTQFVYTIQAPSRLDIEQTKSQVEIISPLKLVEIFSQTYNISAELKEKLIKILSV